jgi:hypothetical protein
MTTSAFIEAIATKLSEAMTGVLNEKMHVLIEESKKELAKKFFKDAEDNEVDDNLDETCGCEKDEEEKETDTSASSKKTEVKPNKKNMKDIEMYDDPKNIKEMVAPISVGNKDRLKRTAPGYDSDAHVVHAGAAHDNDRLAAAKKKLAIKESPDEIHEDIGTLLAVAAGFTGAVHGGAMAVDKIKALMRNRSKIKAQLVAGTPKFIGFKDGELNKLNDRRYSGDDRKEYLAGYQIGHTFWTAKNNGLFESVKKYGTTAELKALVASYEKYNTMQNKAENAGRDTAMEAAAKKRVKVEKEIVRKFSEKTLHLVQDGNSTIDDMINDLGINKHLKEDTLEEKRRIVIKVNSKGRRRRKIMCGKGKKLVGSTCKPISGKDKQVKRIAVRKMKRTLKRKGQGAKKRALRLRKRALTKRHSMGL